ncbi:MAG: amine oxidoreductase [Desulfovibrio sp. S3730MH75]|nr:MAG: amine oxidoreductase [Desulfovibrio sp. S3730MH75]
MRKIKYLILGAGPSGLTLAHSLLDAGRTLDDILVIEKQSVAGGLCRSELVDGAPIDTGGGHFLDVKRKEVLDFVFRFMPREEWDLYERVSKIRIRGMEIDHPLEANLWQFPSEVQADYLESIAQAGCVRGEEMPESFAAWIKWKLGERIAQEYMLPYNRKIWSMDPDELGTYWLYKLPNVSFRETLLSCLEGKPMGALPAHGTFLYPKKFGYGEVWRRMGEALGDSLVTNCPVEQIDLASHTVNGRWQAETIISTIPWTLWAEYCDLPKDILATISSLKNAPIDVDYYPETLNSPAHWIYEPDDSIEYHRLLLRSNFDPRARGYWTETNATRSSQTDGVRFHNEFAYPINTLGKPEAVHKILAWGRSNGIIGLGRWGRWEHMNSDVAVAEALQIASELNKNVVS